MLVNMPEQKRIPPSDYAQAVFRRTIEITAVQPGYAGDVAYKMATLQINSENATKQKQLTLL